MTFETSRVSEMPKASGNLEAAGVSGYPDEMSEISVSENAALGMSDEELRVASEKWGTPSFVFDAEAFRFRLRACQEIVGKNVSLCYAMKANPFLISVAAECIARLEVCSPGELALCERAGIEPSQVVYSGVNKEESDIAAAISYGVGVLTAESLLHAEYLNRVASEQGKTVSVLLRLNAGSQFGMSREDLLWLVDHRDEYPALDFAGIHYFVYTQRKKLKRQRKELDMLVAFMDELERNHGFSVRCLEYGPGLGVPYFSDDDFSDDLAPLRELAPLLREIAARVELTVEMGRFFAAPCGAYLTRVMDQKSNEGTNYAILDGGMNHLTYFGQMMGLHVPPLSNVSLAARRTDGCGFTMENGEGGVANDCADGECTADCVVDEGYCTDASQIVEWCLCGSLCTVNDVLVRAVKMEDLRRGDVLAFRSAGAYSVTEGVYLFLSRTMPRVLLHEGAGEMMLARDFVESYQFNGIAV